VPRTITPGQASDSGVGSLEHLLQIPVRCTPAESLALAPRFRVQSALGPCSSADQTDLYRTLLRNRTRVVPTLVAAYEIALWPTRALPGDAYAAFLPDTLRRFVLELFPMPPDVPAGADSVGRALFAKRLELVARLDRAGVRLMTGTDAPLRNSPPGFGLHEELALFAEAGIPPARILRAAIWEPASYFGMLDSLGTIAPGRIADLVLLDADPLLDIRNTRRIAAVVSAGRIVRP
jgi:hypothetical protein